MNKAKILIVDDEPDIRGVISDILEDEGYQTHTSENAAAARRDITAFSPELILLDIWMPDTDGIALLKEWMDEGRDVSVIMISGHGTVDTAVEAIRIGAYDFLEKPLSTAKLLVTVERAVQNRRLTEENLQLKSRLEPSSELLGDSRAMNDLRQKIQCFAATESWILVQGEPGSGKGVVARSIHRQSRRADGPFIEINLGAIPAENMAIQLFGREDGEIVTGSLETADGGTLVLDEVADLDTDLQAKLLSALEERSFFRVGGRATVQVDVRVIATTNQDLRDKVSQGLFRRDLFDRLNQLPLEVPPLRDHREDIPVLAQAVVHQAVEFEGYPPHRFSPAAIKRLQGDSWPGNVRELQNVVKRLMLTCDQEEISEADVTTNLSPEQAAAQSKPALPEFNMDMRDAREAFEKAYLSFHLEQVGGNMTELATRTGLERTHLYRKLKALGIDTKSGKKSQAAKS